MSGPGERGSDERAARLAAVRVVAVTDRRRMVPSDLLASGDWPAIARSFGEAIARAVDGCPPGSVIVQLREKDLDGGPLLELARAARRFAPVIVNDRLDVALASGAVGVHLPERGLAIADARRLAPHLLVGVSRHAAPLDGAPAGGRDALDNAAGASDRSGLPDLLQLGPIWPTPSKPTAPGLGTSALAWPHGAAVLVAVGGIDTPARAQQAAAAGAAAVAVIRAAWGGASLAPVVAATEAGRAR